MITIHEHTIEIDLLPVNAKILDIGCRGFLFSDFLKSVGYTVVNVDADDNLQGGDYIQCAISNFNGYVDLVKQKGDPQATMISKVVGVGSVIGVPCFTLQRFCEMVNVPYWDLIKIDIEGSEREVIMDMDKPYATQLSIEFHLHTRAYGEKEVDEMVLHLHNLGYETLTHKKTSQHGAGQNYWDSLFILK